MKSKLRELFVVAVAALVAVTVAGCGAKGEGGDKAPAKAAKKPAEPYRAGRIRVDEKPVAVLPQIHHVAEMDLFIGCKRVVGEAEEAGREVPPLCYGTTKRATPPKTLRIEHRENMPSGEGLLYLKELHESAHFVIDKTGAIYQSLDLAWPVRRAGVIRADELRVLSGSAKGHQALFAALAEQYPDIKISVVAAPPAPAKKPAAAPGSKPAEPGKPAVPGKPATDTEPAKAAVPAQPGKPAEAPKPAGHDEPSGHEEKKP